MPAGRIAEYIRQLEAEDPAIRAQAQRSLVRSRVSGDLRAALIAQVRAGHVPAQPSSLRAWLGGMRDGPGEVPRGSGREHGTADAEEWLGHALAVAFAKPMGEVPPASPLEPYASAARHPDPRVRMLAGTGLFLALLRAKRTGQDLAPCGALLAVLLEDGDDRVRACALDAQVQIDGLDALVRIVTPAWIDSAPCRDAFLSNVLRSLVWLGDDERAQRALAPRLSRSLEVGDDNDRRAALLMLCSWPGSSRVPVPVAELERVVAVSRDPVVVQYALQLGGLDHPGAACRTLVAGMLRTLPARPGRNWLPPLAEAARLAGLAEDRAAVLRVVASVGDRARDRAVPASDWPGMPVLDELLIATVAVDAVREALPVLEPCIVAAGRMDLWRELCDLERGGAGSPDGLESARRIAARRMEPAAEAADLLAVASAVRALCIHGDRDTVDEALRGVLRNERESLPYEVCRVLLQGVRAARQRFGAAGLPLADTREHIRRVAPGNLAPSVRDRLVEDDYK